MKINKALTTIVALILLISLSVTPIFAATDVTIPTPVVTNVSVNYKTVYTSYPYEYYNVPCLYVTWNAVSNAEKYIVEVWRYNQEQDTYSQCCYKYNISGTFCEIGNEYTSNDFKPNEELYVSVTAYSETHSSQSETSEKYEITMPNIVLNKIEFDNYNLSMKVGDTQYITPTLSPYNATNRDVKWSSSNINAATISSGGKITAVSEGRTIITCYGLYGEAFATCEVVVTPNENGGESNTEVSTGSGKCGDNATWVLDENGVLTISGTGAIWNSNNYTGWKNLRKYIKKVKVEEGITEIGECSFLWCSNLSSIELPNSLTSIKSASFEGCGLGEITIPQNVSSIDGNVFLSCNNLTNINVANGNSTYFSIDGVLFDTLALTLVSYPTNKQIAHYSVPHGIEIIGKYAVRSDNLKSITLPSTLKTIDVGGFAHCRNLLECNIPNSVSSIGVSAFTSTGLATLILPTSLESLSSHAFYDCNNLDYIVIPKTLTCIGEYAFYNCNNITHINYEGSQEEWNAITIGSNNAALTETLVNFNSTHVHSGGLATCSLKAVCEECGNEYGAFAHSLVFFDYKQSTCKEVGWHAYEKCLNCSYSTYKEISLISHKLDKYGAFPASCETEGNITYYKCSVCEQFFSDSNGENVISQSDTITTPIGHSYSSNTGLCVKCDRVKPGYCGANITWTLDENGVLTLSGTGEMWENFSWTPSEIKEVVICNGITNISAGAFKGCSNLTYISIPNSVISIGSNAFYGTSLKQIVIPDSVVEIEKNALYGCNNLEDLTIPFVGGTQTSNTVLGYIFSSTTSSYSDSTSGAIIYKTTYHIPTTLKKITITKETSLSGSAFKDCSNIEEIVLPNTLTSVASTTFEECTKITDVYYTGTNAQWESLFQGELDATVHFIEIPITSIILNKTNVSLLEGNTETLIATIAPTYATNNSVCWSSSNPNVATVSDGVITAITPGTTIITVSTSDGSITATCSITVNSVISSVFLDKTSTTLMTGDTETLTVIVLPTIATNKSVSWSSSDTSVATVSNGIITAIAPGTVTITVTTLDGSNKTANCSVTVICNHAYSTTLIQGETTHYHECNYCHDRKNEAIHEYTSYTSNGNSTHTGTCICGKVNTGNCAGNTTSATCQTKANCATCGQTYGDFGDHAYDTTVWVSVDNDHHAHKCTCGTYTDSTDHYSADEATCTDEKLCDACGHKMANALGHSYTKKIESPAYLKAEGENCQSHHTYYYACVRCDANSKNDTSESYEGSAVGAHKMSATWTTETDAGWHYHECTVSGCDYKEDGGDCAGGTATCLAKAVCSTCQKAYGEFAEHTFGTTWDYKDASGHAHVCTVNGCNAHGEIKGHTPNIPAATEQSAQYCTACQYQMAAQLNHTHSPATEWTSNATHHWKACGGCDEHLEETSHSYDPNNACDTTCEVCSAVREVTHDFTVEWEKDASGHWHVCTKNGCAVTDTTQNHESAGAATETDPEVCSICGWVINSALGHTTHTPEAEWQKNDTHHWHECTGCVGQELNKAAHNDGDSNGYCDACGYTMSVTPPPHNHSFGTNWVTDANNHWKECECEEKRELGAHVDVNNDGACDTCEYAMSVTPPPHTHSHGTTWVTDANNHWKECECGDKANKAAHADGNNDGKCDACNYQMTTLTPNETNKPNDTANETSDNTNNTNGNNSSNSDTNNGCGSVIGGASIVVISIMSAGAFFIFKKRKSR